MNALRAVVAATHGAVDPAALRAEGARVADIIDFSSNQSPLGPAPEVRAAVSAAVLDAYPDPRAGELCAAAAVPLGVAPECVVAGNGSTELIRLLAQLALSPGEQALSLGPSFGEYEVATNLAGGRFTEMRASYEGGGRGFRYDAAACSTAVAENRPRLCWLCSPNNPTGALVARGLIENLVAAHPETLLVLDEAYCDPLEAPQWSAATLAAGNLVVLRSLTKAWGLAGLRVGFAVAAPETAAALRAAAPPWTVNACAQAAGVVALVSEEHHRAAVSLLVQERERLTAALRGLGWCVEPSQAGFFLVNVGEAGSVRRELLARGCLVRDCTSFGLPEFVRVSPRLPEENDLLLQAWAALPPSA